MLSDEQFINIINASASKGACTINLKTQNTSKQARTILQDTKYAKLAKQHINASVVNAYYNNNAFKQKLDAIAKEYNITVIA